MGIINYGDIKKIFYRVDKLSDYHKIKLKHFYDEKVDDLPIQEYGIFFHLFDDMDDIKKLKSYQKDFLLSMVCSYIQQGCSDGRRFEVLLGDMYKSGNDGTKEDISYFVSEFGPDFIIDMKRYIEIFGRKQNIDIIALTYDTLNWNKVTKRNWRNTIIGMNKEEHDEFE